MSDRDHIPDPEALIRHGASVRGLATAILGDASAADDVAQEAYLAALRGGDVPVREPGAWLRGVTRNLARRWIRTESRRRSREEARPLPSSPASPDETAARLETETALTDAVRALSEPYRTVVVLRYFDDLTTAETAERTGAPEATVKTRLRRALAMLRDALDNRYGARSAWLPLLVRVARPRDPTVATAAVGTTALVAGGIIMAKKILVVTVFAAVLAAVFVSPMLWDDSAPESPPNGTPDEPSLVAGGPASSPDTAADADPAPGDTPTPAPAGNQFRVIVRYADGSPADGARVKLVGANGKSAGESRTGPDGAAALTATGERGVVHVAALHAAPESRDVDALAGTEVRVNLKLGSVISGTLFFGEEPAADVEVHLNSLDDSVPQMVAVTDRRGGFAFTGLEPEARFSFFVGWDVEFLEPPGGANILLTAPETGLAIRARRHPALRGIVVRADGAPVGGAVVELACLTKNVGGGCRRVSAGEDGRFEVRMRGADGDVESLTLTVTTTGDASREVIELKPDLLRDGAHDLGRVVLRASRSFEFAVRGPDGKPVRGAIVLALDNPSRASPPTGAAGRTKLEVAAGTTAVQAGAAGEGNVEVRLPDEPSETIPVTLPGGTLLTVRTRTRAGKVPINLQVHIDAEANLLDVPESLAHGFYGRAGASSPFMSHVSETENRLHFLVPGDGVVRIGGIRSGVAFRLRVVDGVTNDVLDVRDLKLETRERCEVDVVLSLVDKTLVLAVRDPAGQPVSRAYVAVRAGRGSIHATTGKSGFAVVPGLRGETVRVTVTKPGCVPFVRAIPVAELSTSKPIPVVLRPGRKVRLTVSNAAGTPVACEWTEARGSDLDYVFQGNEVDEGIYLFSDLPAGEVRLKATHAGAVREVVVAAASSEARITVPATGSVVVRFAGTLDEPVLHRMRLTPTAAGAGTEVTVDVDFFPRRKQWEIRLPAVLPGTYRVSLEHWTDSEENDEDVYETCRKGGVVKVAAGREAETSLPR